MIMSYCPIGNMPPRGRRARQAVAGTPEATGNHGDMSEGESSHPQAEVNVEEQLFTRIAQRLAASIGSVESDPEKKYSIERLKALGATTFEGTVDPVEAEAWLNLLEKCYRVMRCPEDRKVELAVFLLQKGAEDWWRIVESRKGDIVEIGRNEFKKAFQEKYCPRSFRDAKWNEFLRLIQGSMTVAEYEKKYTELSKYATTIIANETN